MLRRKKAQNSTYAERVHGEGTECLDGFVTPISQMYSIRVELVFLSVHYTCTQSACESAKLAPPKTANTKRTCPLPLFDNLWSQRLTALIPICDVLLEVVPLWPHWPTVCPWTCHWLWIGCCVEFDSHTADKEKLRLLDLRFASGPPFLCSLLIPYGSQNT